MSRDHRERDAVFSALGDDEICEAFGGLDEGLVHRPNGLVVLRAHLRKRAASLLEVPSDPAHHADVCVGVYEHFDVHPSAQLGVCQDQDPLDHNHRRCGDVECLAKPCVGGKIVDRLLDGLPRSERVQVQRKELVVERIGVIKVYPGAGFVIERREVFVVAVVFEQGGRAFGQGLKDRAGDGGLA